MKVTEAEKATDHHHHQALTFWLATFSFQFLLEDVCEAGNARTSKLLIAFCCQLVDVRVRVRECASALRQEMVFARQEDGEVVK